MINLLIGWPPLLNLLFIKNPKDKTPCQPPSPKPWFYPRVKALGCALTLTTPKPLVEVGGQPLIVWHIKALKQAGITDITINVSWLADKLLNAIGDGSQYGVTIHWSIEPWKNRETAGGIQDGFGYRQLKRPAIYFGQWGCGRLLIFAQLRHLKLNDSQLICYSPTKRRITQLAICLRKWQGQCRGTPKYTFAGISVMSQDYWIRSR